MPVEIIPKNKIQVSNPSEASIREKTIWDNVKLNWKSGFEENTVKLFSDYALKSNAINKGQAEIRREDWNENHPLWNPNVKWEPYLTYDLVHRANESMRIGSQRLDYSDKSGLGGKTAGFIASFGGTVLDPINLIPVPFLGQLGNASSKLIKFSKRAGAVGATSAAIETTLQPLAASAYGVRGQDLTTQDVFTNIGMAALGGAIFYGLIDGGVNSYKYLRGLRHPDEVSNKVLKDYYETERPYGFDITPYINRLKHADELNTRKNQNNFYNDSQRIEPKTGQAIFVDSRGRFSYDRADNTLLDDKITMTTETNSLVLTGSKQELLKHLNALRQKDIPAQQIVLRITDTNDSITISKNMFGDAESLSNNIKKFLSSQIDTNALANGEGTYRSIDQFVLGPDVVFTFKNKNTRAELEVTTRNGEEVQRMIIFEDGKRRVVTDQSEIQKIIDESQKYALPNIVNNQTGTTKFNLKQSSDVSPVDPKRSEIEQGAAQMDANSRSARNDTEIESTPQEREANKLTDQETLIAKVRRDFPGDSLKDFGLEIRRVDGVEKLFSIETPRATGVLKRQLSITREKTRNYFLQEQEIINRSNGAKDTLGRAVDCDKPGV